jgi:ABC-type microcin C transport system permease subunit YejB
MLCFEVTTLLLAYSFATHSNFATEMKFFFVVIISATYSKFATEGRFFWEHLYRNVLLNL